MATVKIIHPEHFGVAEVPEESLSHHYRAGWRLLTDEETAAQVKPPLVPQPITKTQAAKAAKSAAKASESEA